MLNEKEVAYMDEKKIQQLWSKTIGADQLERHGGGATYKAPGSITGQSNVYLPLMTLLNENDTQIEVIQPQRQQGDETINETAVGNRPHIVEQETAVDDNSPIHDMPLDKTLDDSVLNSVGAQTIDDPQSQALLAATEGAQTMDDPQSQALLAAAQGSQTMDDTNLSTLQLVEDGSQTLDAAAESDVPQPAEEGAQTIDDPQSQALLAAAQGSQTMDDTNLSTPQLVEDGSQTLDAGEQVEISDLEKGAQTLFGDTQTNDHLDTSGEQTMVGDPELENAQTVKNKNYSPPQSSPPSPSSGSKTTHGMKETLHEGVKNKLKSMRSENFVIGTEIARGGMGIINKGEQKSLKREIAIKRIIPGSINNTTQQKFISEALVTAYLDHPNIVPVYELGQNINGNVFLTMKLVKGVEWKKILNKTAESEKFDSYDLEAHLRTLIDVCDAMAFAHSKGIVHNDLKPENIMIGEFGEVLVMDWGLAVSQEEISPELRTLHKSMVTSPMGTPHYMSPELAEGCGDEIGPWTDTYLLGAMLHEIITGKPPHYDENIWKSLMKAIASDPPTFANKRDDFFPDEIPQELKNICCKALAKNIEDRYQNVDDFQQAISYFLKHRESLIITREGQKILGVNEQKLSTQEIKLHGKERNYLYAQYSKAVSCFEQALKLWEGNTAAEQGRFAARLAYSNIALKNDDLGLSEAQIDELDSQDSQVQKVREQIQRAKQEKIRAEKSSQRIRILLVASVLVTFLVLSVSLYFIRQQHLLAENNAKEAKEQEKMARINAQEAQEQRDIAQRETKEAQRQHQRAEQSAKEAEQSAKEAEEAALKAEMEAKRADAERAKARREERIRFAEAKAAKKTLAKISLQKASEAFDTQQWKDSILFAGASLELTKDLPAREVQKIREQNKQFIKLGLMKEGLVWETTPHYRAKLSHISSSRDGKMLTSTIGDSVHLWDANTGRLNNIFQESSSEFLFAVFNNDNKEIATVSKDHCIYLWPIEENGNEKLLRGHQGEITAVIYRANGEELVSIAKDKTIRIWDTADETLKKTIACNHIARDSFSIHLHGEQLLFLDTDNKLIAWNLSTGQQVYSSTESFSAFTVHPDEKSIVVAAENAIQAIALDDFQQRKTLGNFNKQVKSLAYNDDGNLIITSSQEIIAVNSSSFKVTETKECVPGLQSLHYNKYLRAVVGLEKYACIYPLSQSKLKDHEELFHRPRNIESLRYSPNMKTIAITSDNLLQLFDEDGKYISEWQNNVKIRDIAYHPSSAFIAAASSDNKVYIWSTKKHKAQKLISHDGEMTMLRIAPNQQLYATVAKDNVICLWNAAGKIVHYLEGHTDAINDIHFQQNTEYIASAGQDKTVRIWNLKTGREEARFTTNEAMYKVRYSPDGQKLVACSQKTIFLWSVQNQKLVQEYKGHKREITSITFDRTSSVICSGDKDKKIWVWTLSSNKPKYVLRGHDAQITDLKFSRRGDIIYSISSDRSLRLWNLRSGKLERSFTDHSADVTSMDLSKDERFAASTSGKNVYLWDLQSGRRVAQFTGHTSWVKDVVFSNDDQYLISCSSDKTIKLWSIRSQNNVATLSGHDDQVMAVRQIQNHVVSISRKETIAWNTSSRKPYYVTYTGHTAPVNTVAVSPDGKWIISGSDDKTLRIWSTKTRKVHQVLPGHNSSILKVAISPKGQFIGSASDDKTIRIWNKNKTISVLWHKGPVTFVKFHPEGSSIVSASADKTTRLWNIINGQEIRTFKEDQTLVNDISFSPDGNTVAIAYKNKPAVLLNLGTEIPVAYIDRENKNTRGITYSPDGKYIVSATNSIVRLWHTPQKKHIAFFGDHSATVNSVSYSPDGKRFVSSSQDQTVKLWDVKSRKLLTSLRGHKHKVVRVEYTQDFIIGASENNQLYVWSAKDFSLKGSLAGEQSFAVSNDRLVYKDKTKIVIRNLQSNTIEHSINYKEKLFVLRYSYDGNWLIAGSTNIQLWHLQAPHYSYVLYNGNAAIRTLVHTRGDKIIFSKSDGVIHVWDLKKREEVQTFRGHKGAITQLFYDGKFHALFSASQDDTVIWWDLVTSKKVSVVAQHRKGVLSIDHLNGVLLTASLDKTIRLWQTLPIAKKQLKTPQWILKIVAQTDEKIPTKSQELLFRGSIPERSLDYAIDNEPLRVIQYLYHSRVSDTFAIKSIPNLRLPGLGK